MSFHADIYSCLISFLEIDDLLDLCTLDREFSQLCQMILRNFKQDFLEFKKKINYKQVEKVSSDLPLALKYLTESLRDNIHFDINQELESSRERKSGLAIVLYKYAGMGYWHALSFVPRIARKYDIHQKIYNVSMIGGSNGYEQGDNQKKYDNDEPRLVSLKIAFEEFKNFNL